MSERRHPPGLVVVVDGPSYAGKTTTVAALQRAWPRVRSGPLLDVGVERCLASFGPAAARWRELVVGERRPPSATSPPRWGPLGRELVAGMHRAAAVWAVAGFDVVVEHVLLDRTTADDLAASLAGLPVLHVGLTCDPDVLEARAVEQEGPSSGGRAVAELAATAHAAIRDVVLDTTEMATDELVDAIVDEVPRRVEDRR